MISYTRADFIILIQKLTAFTRLRLFLCLELGFPLFTMMDDDGMDNDGMDDDGMDDDGMDDDGMDDDGMDDDMGEGSKGVRDDWYQLWEA